MGLTVLLTARTSSNSFQEEQMIHPSKPFLALTLNDGLEITGPLGGWNISSEPLPAESKQTGLLMKGTFPRT